jgi:hypothetical protein
MPADQSGLSRARRSMEREARNGALQTGTVPDSEPGTIPAQRCIAPRCTASRKSIESVLYTRRNPTSMGGPLLRVW